MLISAVLTLAIAIALFMMGYDWWQNQIHKPYPSTKKKISDITGDGGFEDWESVLNIASHRDAVQKYCLAKGYDYEAPVNPTDYGSCLYTQKTCEADSNPHYKTCIATKKDDGTVVGLDNDGKPCNLDQKPYLEWHTDANGKGRCLISHFPPSFIQNVCEARGLGKWYQGTPKCDADGYCQLNPDDLPSCTIEAPYCDKMGMDFLSDGGKGDCDVSEVQGIFESLVGKTVTRTWKRNTEAMIRECSDSPFSWKCASSVGSEVTTMDQILLNTADKEMKDYMDNMKKKCSGDIYASTDSFTDCAGSILPGMYISGQVVKFADNMLNGALGWTGLPPGLLQKASGYISKYGKVALNAIYHAGEDAIKAFDMAGDAMYHALDNVGLGPVGDIVKGVVGNVLFFGKEMAGIVANVTKEAIGLFTNTIAPAAYHVFHAVINAVLHPKEFFTGLAKDVGRFFTDPIGSMKSAFTGMKSLVKNIAHAVATVVKHLYNMAKNLLGDLGKQLVDMANHIASTFKDIGNDIADAGRAVGHFFESVF
jgi:hypothetical protein